MMKPKNWNPRPVDEDDYAEQEDDQLDDIADKREDLLDTYRCRAEGFEDNRNEWMEYALALEAKLDALKK
jgi:hypothetical protein